MHIHIHVAKAKVCWENEAFFTPTKPNHSQQPLRGDIIQLSGHGVLLKSKRHIDQRLAELNMIKFTVQ